MRRCRERIISEILKVCLEDVSKTRIVDQVGLNFKSAIPKIEMLVKGGYIVQIDSYPGKYRTTEKGIQLLNNLRVVLDLIR